MFVMKKRCLPYLKVPKIEIEITKLIKKRTHTERGEELNLLFLSYPIYGMSHTSQEYSGVWTT